MSGLFERANELAILSVGRNPQWVEQLLFTGKPSAGMGVYCEEAVNTFVDVKLREFTQWRTARISLPTFSAAATYTITIDGIAVAVGAEATRAAAIGAIEAAINAAAIVTDIVEAFEEDTGVTANVAVVGDNFSIAVAATAGVIAAVADPVSARVRIWFTWRGTNAPEGFRSTPALIADIDGGGFAERFATAGIDRLYVQVSDVVGHGSDGASVTLRPVEVQVGPAVAETD